MVANYQTKASLLNDVDKLFEYRRVRYCLFTGKDYVDLKTGSVILTYKDAFSIFTARKDTQEWKELERLYNAFKKRVSRVRSRIEKYLTKGDCYFVTLTFTDDVLDSTSAKIRRKYVSRWFKSQSSHYVANIDFGSKNNREHYHGIIVGKPDKSSWPYGFADCKKIGVSQDDQIRLSKYIAKLTNHAIKETTKGASMIYSREPIVVEHGSSKTPDDYLRDFVPLRGETLMHMGIDAAEEIVDAVCLDRHQNMYQLGLDKFLDAIATRSARCPNCSQSIDGHTENARE